MTTLIKNIFVVDGSGASPVRSDVLVRDNKIVALGSFPNYKADRVILGNEGYLVPGFIDVDAGSDRYMTLFSAPAHTDFLLQGITSVVVGHCGFSLAPMLYGSMGRFSDWSRGNHNIDWKSVADFLKALGRLPLGVNIASLVGHKIIREDILKNPNEFRKLTANELRVFRGVVARSLDEGAFGLSFGLGYYPYQNVSFHELRALVDIIHEHKGVFSVHLRNEREKLIESVDEVLRLSQETAVAGIISHLRPFVGFEDEYRQAIAHIEEKSAKANVYFDINPFNSSAVTLDTFLPPSLLGQDRSFVLSQLRDKKVEKEIELLLPRIDSKKIIILNAPGMEFLNGTSLFTFAANRQLSARQALLTLMEITQLRGVVFFENLNKEEVARALLSERALISTNSPSFDSLSSFKPDRSTKTFPTYFSMANSEGVSIEKAVAKVSGLVASIFGFDGRGFVSDGYFADLVLLTKGFSVSMVMVNGVVSVEGGSVLSSSSGNILSP